MNTDHSPKPILAVHRGALTAKDKEKATKAGYLVIEADDPDKIRVIQPITEQLLAADDLTMAAMTALGRSNSDTVKATFFTEIHKAIKSKKGGEP